MKFLAIVPARSGSKEVPNKNLILFKKKRITNIAIDIGLSIKEIKKVIISTDSKKILVFAKKYGNKIMKIKRKKKLSEDKTPMLPVLKDALIKFEKKYEEKIDAMIILDPTSPLRQKKDVEKGIKIFKKENVDLLLSCHKATVSPYFSLFEKKGKFYQLSKGKNLNIGCRQESPPIYAANTVVWIYSRRSILNHKIRIPRKTKIIVIENNKTLEINSQIDRLLLRKIKSR